MNARGARRAAAVLTVAVLAGSGAAMGAGAKPTLRAEGLYPIVIRGTNFRATEKVTVTFSSGTTAKRLGRADRRGRFAVSFALRLPRCGTALVRATGSMGSRAQLQLPRPNCREP